MIKFQTNLKKTYAQWKKPHDIWFHLYEISVKNQAIETEIMYVVPQDGELGINS